MAVVQLMAIIALLDAASVDLAEAPRTVRIPVTQHAGSGQSATISLEAFVYEPAGPGKHPVAIFSHGSSGGSPKQSIPATIPARYLVSRGFTVIVPMRRGRGASEGVSLESEDKNCDVTSWWPGLDAAFEDLTATIDFARTLPDADTSRVVLAGASRGGFLSVAYAARGQRRAKVAGVINFVGGWVAQAEDNCPTDFNLVSYREFGARTRVPELWLYGDKDPFYSSESIRSYRAAFEQSGGKLRFDLIPSVSKNGHWLPNAPELWSGLVAQYLESIGLGSPVGPGVTPR